MKVLDMQISNVKLLKAIQTANTYFHQHMDSDKYAKKAFYRVKDEIIKGILKGQFQGMKWQFVRYEVDNLNIRYAVIDINASTMTTYAYLGVHFPVKKMPESMRNNIPEGTELYRYVRAEYSNVISTDEYREAFEYMRKVAKHLWKKKVLAMKVNELQPRFGGTLKGTGYYILLGKKNIFKLYKRGLDIESQPNPIVIPVSVYKRAVAETLSFNFDGVSAWLLENGIEMPNQKSQ